MSQARILFFVPFALSLLLNSGCASSSTPNFPLSAIEKLNSSREVAVAIKRVDLESAIKDTILNRRVRIIQIFKPGDPLGALPTYRVFDVDKGSVLGMLGVQDKDVILGIDGRIAFDPKEIRSYIASDLPSKGNGALRIKRDSDIFEIKATIVE